ncbi:coiled-coil domain-containing protein 114 [Chanos chanos]|uniref:Coiled-coil domain-containing protein 114 n=1 Tax=Chanos chanos TaxID=29144 RepID=A0A6J2VQ83_CHACN|nr:coiled-coil domain-containing protein 114-like [Chanos chanos]
MPRRRSAMSVHSDASDLDIDGIAETEMGKLQRQFRIMEGDRQAYSIQAQELIRKQRQEIESLHAEQEELQRSLHVSDSQSRRHSDSHDAQQLRTLLAQRDELEEQLERERQSQAELEKEVLSMERKLAELRKGEIYASLTQTSQVRQTKKTTSTLENKLDLALIRFNEQLTKNGCLREELETLRVERVRFQQLHRRLEKELQEIRRDIGNIINLSTSAYEARVEAQSKMNMMKEKAVKDLAQYTVEMKELERVIAHERRLKEFMTTKCNERASQDEGQDLSRRQELKEQRRTDSGQETLDTLEEVFQRIQNVTGEDDLDVLVTKFIQVEDRNFALFNYVNEQNTEAETLRDQIKQTREEMEQFHLQGLQQEQEHHSALREVDEQQRQTEAQAQEYETQANAIGKILDQIKTGVSTVFGLLECDRSLVEDMLGSSSGIRNSNIMAYLGLVEQKTNELLTLQAFINSKDLEKDYDPKDVARILLGQSPELHRQTVVIQPPITGDDYNTEGSPLTDEEERPLTQGELRQRVMKGVLRKEGALRPGGVKLSKISMVSSNRQHSPEA